MTPVLPPQDVVATLLRSAFAEDLGGAGDITTDPIVAPDGMAHGLIVTRQPGCIAGVPIALAAFAALNDSVVATALVAEGTTVPAGATVAEVSGSARAILSAERVALNLLGHMSGIATATAEYVAAVAGTGAVIRDTRKTTPGLRAIEKYAVRAAGGENHRFGLSDGVLIKDNHIAVAGSIAAAVARVRAACDPGTPIQVEVDTEAQLEQALEAGVESILLDNMDPAAMERAVRLVDGRATLEASGGVTLAGVRAVAETGVDFIAVGWLTHSAPALDVGLDLTLGATP